jgi:hypothetical protein
MAPSPAAPRRARCTAAQRAARFVQQRVAEVERAAVVRAQHEEAQRLAVEALQHIGMVKKLPSDLDIFSLSMFRKPLCIQTLTKGSAARALALRDLVLVVRELQVQAAAVDVEGLAEQRAAHGRALDVPARAAGAVGAGPLGVGRLVGLGGLPEHEVQRVFLVAEHGHALAGAQLVERLARELAVAREAPHREVDVAAGGTVGQALVLEPPIRSSICGT